MNQPMFPSPAALATRAILISLEGLQLRCELSIWMLPEDHGPGSTQKNDSVPPLARGDTPRSLDGPTSIGPDVRVGSPRPSNAKGVDPADLDRLWIDYGGESG